VRGKCLELGASLATTSNFFLILRHARENSERQTQLSREDRVSKRLGRWLMGTVSVPVNMLFAEKSGSLRSATVHSSCSSAVEHFVSPKREF
jgi:hypothetical protein